MYNLHYADKELKSTIPRFTFSRYEDLCDFISNIFDDDDKKTVYVFTYDNFSKKKKREMEEPDLLVTSNKLHIWQYLIKKHPFVNLKSHSDFYLQEYFSYEAAYEIALGMKEGDSSLCYEPK